MTIFSSSYILLDILLEIPGTEGLVNSWPRKNGVSWLAFPLSMQQENCSSPEENQDVIITKGVIDAD